VDGIGRRGAAFERPESADGTVFGVRKTSAAAVVLSQSVPVEPHRDYLFRARLRTDGNLGGRIGWRSERVVEQMNGDWRLRSGPAELRITPLGEGWNTCVEERVERGDMQRHDRP